MLYSSTPVYWRLSFDGDAFFNPTNQQRSSYSRNIYISKGSTLKNYQDVPINVHHHNQMDNLFGRSNNAVEQHSKDESISEIIRNKWGALTTFSRISGANRISISLPQGIKIFFVEMNLNNNLFRLFNLRYFCIKLMSIIAFFIGESLHQRCLIKQSNSGIETQEIDDTSSGG